MTQYQTSESKETVTVCAHSLKTGLPVRMQPGEMHVCNDRANCPGSECQCIPAQMSLEELDRLTEVPSAE